MQETIGKSSKKKNALVFKKKLFVEKEIENYN